MEESERAREIERERKKKKEGGNRTKKDKTRYKSEAHHAK